MVAIEKMGLLKMDFLGLTTLTILDDALGADRSRLAANIIELDSNLRVMGPGDLREGLSQCV